MGSQNLSISIASRAKNLILLGGRNSWLCFVIWIVFIVPVQAAIELRVAIEKNVNQLQVGSSTTAIVRNSAGQKLGEIAGMNAFSALATRGGISLGKWRSGQLIVEPTGDGYVWIGDRWYRGRTHIIRQGQGLVAINYVDLEDYLYSVVGSEMLAHWPLEALKAQAVAARSYAIHKHLKSSNRLYDLDTTTSTQVYKGLKSESSTTHDAVNDTVGQTITYQGKIILAVFHSSSGGHTENVEDVWSSPLPYLRGVIDFDREAPVFEWTKNFSNLELSSRISGVGNVTAMIPEQVTPLGRIKTMKVVGDRGSKRISGNQLRKILDLRSTLFRVRKTGGEFQVYGRGFGHGIGMSQWGAYYLAQQGMNYRQILAHYYPSTRLDQVNNR